MTLTQEVVLDQTDLKDTTVLRNRKDEIDSDIKEWCFDLARAVEKRGAQKRLPFLEAVMPQLGEDRRRRLLQVGQEISRISGRRRLKITDIPYGTSVLRDICSIPEEHRDWAYEQKRTQAEIRAYKKQLKVRAANPQKAEMW